MGNDMSTTSRHRTSTPKALSWLWQLTKWMGNPTLFRGWRISRAW